MLKLLHPKTVKIIDASGTGCWLPIERSGRHPNRQAHTTLALLESDS
jgi:hypothetical protein